MPSVPSTEGDLLSAEDIDATGDELFVPSARLDVEFDPVEEGNELPVQGSIKLDSTQFDPIAALLVQIVDNTGGV